MLLAVDIGNSSISVALFDVSGENADGELVFVSKISSDMRRTSDEFAGLILNIFAVNGKDPSEVTSAILSSVVPQLTDVVKCALGKLTGVRIYVLGPGMKTGLNIRTDSPSELGSDIVANAVYVISKLTLPAIIVDAGTATSVFAVGADRTVLGGCIIPGLRKSLDALKESTAQLPYVSLSVPDRAIGKNTADSMRAGLVLGHAMAVDGMIERFKKEMNVSEATVVLSGGCAQYLMGVCEHTMMYEPYLTLKGLCIIRRLAEKKRPGNREGDGTA
ncbi:MAG: type III pantothenate kinase [Eubacteriales bacterium]